MSMMFRPFFFIVCAWVIFGARLCAEETNSVPAPATDTATQSVVNGYLQIQAQLHDTQLAIENNRAEAAAAAQRNADAMAARIQTLEQTIAAQRASDVDSARKAQQFMLTLVAVFGTAGLAVMLLMVYFQWRVVNRLVELPALQPQVLTAGNVRPPPLMANAVVEQSNARLFGAVDELQKRILELEHGSRAMLAEKNPSTANGSHNISEAKKENSTDRDREECVANLLSEGQALLDAQEPEKALECFDVAIGLDPKHAEALVKKGGALEKLGRSDEAIACYDRAIEANGALTIAHLHKGGLFNRLARYDEALQCYEQALRTQEKKMPGAQVAA
jgi:tetratricopeptide (TPR) repeat protein